MQRQHSQPRIRQPLDQQPVRALDRHQLNLQAHQRSAQPPQPRLLLHERRGQKLLARRVANQHIVLFRHPVNAGVIAICTPHRSGIHFTAPRPRGTVAGAHRQALTGATSCCRYAAPHPCREGLVCIRPRTGGDGLVCAAGPQHNAARAVCPAAAVGAPRRLYRWLAALMANYNPPAASSWIQEDALLS